MAVGTVSTGGVAGATTAQSATTYEAGRRYSASELRAAATPEMMVANIRQDIQAARAQIQSLSEQVQSLKSKPLATVNDLEAVQGQIWAVQQQIQSINVSIDLANKQIDYLSGVPPVDRMYYPLMFLEMGGDGVRVIK